MSEIDGESVLDPDSGATTEGDRGEPDESGEGARMEDGQV